jgi:hypothetical protein
LIFVADYRCRRKVAFAMVDDRRVDDRAGKYTQCGWLLPGPVRKLSANQR